MWIDWRWRGVLLAFSLLANVFLTGVVAGHLLTGGPSSLARRGQGEGLSVAAWVRDVKPPADERKHFGAVMRSHRDTIEAKRAVLKDANKALREAIAAPVYDRTKVEAAFAALRRASAASQETTQTALSEALGVLSPETRAKLAPPP
jgi:Spy/CpxP family protein refolding chaperone